MYAFVNTATPLNPVTDAYVSEIEKQYGIRFPDLLRAYYLENNGREIFPITFRIDGLYYEVGKITQLKDPKLSLEQLLQIQRRQDFPVRQMIPIADDRGGGLYYCHEVTQEIYHSYLEAEDDFLYVCRGIDQFFRILEEAYQRDPSNPYDINKETRRDKPMEEKEYLPLGSIVLLRGGAHRVMIIARGMNMKRNDETYFFDYAAVPYPDGLTNDQLIYFNKDGINKVYFHGYKDDEDDIVVTALQEYLDTHPNINRAIPSELNAQQ